MFLFCVCVSGVGHTCIFPTISILIAWCFLGRYMTTLLIKEVIYRSIIILSLHDEILLPFLWHGFWSSHIIYLFSPSIFLKENASIESCLTRDLVTVYPLLLFLVFRSNFVLCSRTTEDFGATHNSRSQDLPALSSAALSQIGGTWFFGTMYW